MGLKKFIKRAVKKVSKPVIKLIDHLPGGKYLTGTEQARQKHLYNTAINEHNVYGEQAQRTINDFSSRLNEAMGQLGSLEQQRQQLAAQSPQLQGYVDQYRSGMQSVEQHKMNLGTEANSLYEIFENFKSKAPNLAEKISEVQKLPDNFNQMFEGVLRQKESLRGLNEDEAGGEIRRHRSDVENLKKSREEMELKIRTSMDEIVRSHAELGGERTNLENRLNSYGYAQGRVLQAADHFTGVKGQLETIIKNYKAEGQRLENQYNISRSQAESLNNELNNYSNAAQSHLEALANTANFRAGKLQKASSNTGLLRGIGLAGLTYGLGSYLAPAATASSGAASAGGAAAGAGSAAQTATSFGESLLNVLKSDGFLGSISTGLKYAAPVLGMATYMGAMNRSRGLGSLERVDLQGNRENYSNSLGSLTSGGISYDKVGLPDLNGIKQSLSHFGMPTVPKLQDLPKLGDAIGKIVAPQELASSGLGLPQMTSADGKKYSSEVLYDMDLLKELKKVSNKLGTPYLRGNGASNRSNVVYA